MLPADAASRRQRWTPPQKAAAVGVLVFCCVLWGWSFPTMQYASRAFDTHVIRDRVNP
jgi:hypothetical protein